MQAGTNAAISVQNLNVKLSDTYAALKDIPFITSVYAENSNDFASKIK